MDKRMRITVHMAQQIRIAHGYHRDPIPDLFTLSNGVTMCRYSNKDIWLHSGTRDGEDLTPWMAHIHTKTHRRLCNQVGGLISIRQFAAHKAVHKRDCDGPGCPICRECLRVMYTPSWRIAS